MGDNRMLDGAPETNFIREIVAEDLRTGKNGGRVATRFPPEPNGYLHIGHAKAICVDFGIAEAFGGTCNLRFDDTNPTKEDVEYVDAIQEDIRWLGFDWGDRMYYASDYFEKLYEFACVLIRKGKAYVDDLTEDQIREYRGNFYKKGIPSPYRDRSVAENLDLFARMRAGEFEEGSRVLRARIDLDSQDMNLRDPILYRIRKVPHHRTGTRWCIYPMYDFAHPLSDAIERITYSLCSLEFEGHRPLYNWVIQECEAFPSRQIEFARLNVTYTILSKRKLLELVEKGIVRGWDDPRMPTLAGMRRRGYTPEAIRAFADRVGVAKNDSIVDVALLEHAVREDLNRRCPRAFGVVRPLRVIIDNFPPDRVDWLDCPWHPEDASMGTRKVPFSREIFIEREDFREDPPRGWFRLAPGREVRLRYACLVTCTRVVKDERGEVRELHVDWDPASAGGSSPDGRTVKGTLHWVSASHAKPVELRLYDRLFDVPDPADAGDGRSFLEHVNPRSLEVVSSALVEPALAAPVPGARFQFERVGYFCADPDSTPDRPVFNRTVTLKDSWARIEARVSEKKMDVPPANPETPVTPPRPPVEPTPAVALAPLKEQVSIDDFARLDLRVGRVVEAGPVEGAKKLVRLGIDLGEGRLRTVFAGIRAAYPDPSVLVGKRLVVVANLKPREMKWGVSEGMVLAAGNPEQGHIVVTVEGEMRPGSTVT